MGMSRPFIILALPRSRTAWVSCFLTCGNLFCQHEVYGVGVTPNEIARSIKEQRARYSGICCPGSLLVWRELVSLFPDATYVYLRRPRDESQASLARVSGVSEEILRPGFDALERAAREFVEEAEPYVVDSQNLSDEFWARMLWSWVAPDEPLPQAHLDRMMKLHIEQEPSLIRAVVASA